MVKKLYLSMVFVKHTFLYSLRVWGGFILLLVFFKTIGGVCAGYLTSLKLLAPATWFELKHDAFIYSPLFLAILITTIITQLLKVSGKRRLIILLAVSFLVMFAFLWFWLFNIVHIILHDNPSSILLAIALIITEHTIALLGSVWINKSKKCNKTV